MTKGPFTTGKSPFPKGGYIVATEDGSQIICTLQAPDYKSEEQMIEVARFIESRISHLLNKQMIIDPPDYQDIDRPIGRLATKIAKAGR